MKLLVSGSRSITDTEFIHDVLDRSPFDPETVVQGKAEGVDQNALGWAVKNGKDVESHPIPDWVWEQVGPKAGPLRNTHMLNRVDAVVAIWDGESSGTRDVVDKTEAMGLPLLKVVVNVDDDGEVTDTVLWKESDGDQMMLTEFAEQ